MTEIYLSKWVVSANSTKIRVSLPPLEIVAWKGPTECIVVGAGINAILVDREDEPRLLIVETGTHWTDDTGQTWVSPELTGWVKTT